MSIPAPFEDGDHAVVSLESLSGTEQPVKQDEMMLHVGADDTLPAFTENLRGLSPGEEKDFEVTYPEDYGQPNWPATPSGFTSWSRASARKNCRK